MFQNFELRRTTIAKNTCCCPNQ